MADVLPASTVTQWPDVLHAAEQLLNDLRRDFPMYAANAFSEVEDLIKQLLKLGPPVDEIEMQERLVRLGMISVAAYRVRQTIEHGD